MKDKGVTDNYIKRCRNLRKAQTDAERKLWFILRNRGLCGVKFKRQYAIKRYILDFYSPEYKLAIEADGGQHYTKDGIARDAIRSQELETCGIRILRLNDLDILTNIEGVYEVIARTINETKMITPHPFPLPKGEREIGKAAVIRLGG